MDQNVLKKLLKLYKKSNQLLKTGKFGEGLWPLSPESGQFLYWLIRFFNLKSGLEVGAGVGYSSAWLTAGFQKTGGHVITFEYFLPKVEQWEKHMDQLFGKQYSKTITMIPSDLERGLIHLDRQKYDFVFFDQRKEDYARHLQLLLPFLKKGAFIAVDNAISHREFCQDYLNVVKNDRRFSSTTLQLGQGIELTRYL